MLYYFLLQAHSQLVKALLLQVVSVILVLEAPNTAGQAGQLILAQGVHGIRGQGVQCIQDRTVHDTAVPEVPATQVQGDQLFHEIKTAIKFLQFVVEVRTALAHSRRNIDATARP